MNGPARLLEVHFVSLDPWTEDLEIRLPGREDAVLGVQTDQPLRERIAELAAKNTKGALSPEELDEYAGYVRANKFVAVLRREARKFKSGSAA